MSDFSPDRPRVRRRGSLRSAASGTSANRSTSERVEHDTYASRGCRAAAFVQLVLMRSRSTASGCLQPPERAPSLHPATHLTTNVGSRTVEILITSLHTQPLFGRRRWIDSIPVAGRSPRPSPPLLCPPIPLKNRVGRHIVHDRAIAQLLRTNWKLQVRQDLRAHFLLLDHRYGLHAIMALGTVQNVYPQRPPVILHLLQLMWVLLRFAEPPPCQRA